MDIIFILVICLIAIGFIGAFMKGIYSILPITIQAVILRVSKAIDEVMKVLALLIYPFAGGYIGSLWSSVGTLVGCVIGLVIGLGVRQSILEKQAEVALLEDALFKRTKESAVSDLKNEIKEEPPKGKVFSADDKKDGISFVLGLIAGLAIFFQFVPNGPLFNRLLLSWGAFAVTNIIVGGILGRKNESNN